MESPMISLVSIDVHEAESLVLEVLRSGQLAQGPMVERLEKVIGQWAGVEHAVAVSSGTAAILLSLQAWELKPGDEVITSPFTFSATLNAIITSGATASFVDIHPMISIWTRNCWKRASTTGPRCSCPWISTGRQRTWQA
jgi:dTDP-4-amino-4,6-dideoxygalactose transaminase